MFVHNWYSLRIRNSQIFSKIYILLWDVHMTLACLLRKIDFYRNFTLFSLKRKFHVVHNVALKNCTPCCLMKFLILDFVSHSNWYATMRKISDADLKKHWPLKWSIQWKEETICIILCRCTLYLFDYWSFFFYLQKKRQYWRISLCV